MTARQIIEAEDPKDFLLQRSPQRRYEKLRALLLPRGWTADDERMCLTFVREAHMPATRQEKSWKLSTATYRLKVLSRSNAETEFAQHRSSFAILRIEHLYSTGQQTAEAMPLGSMESVLRHLNLFRLIEAEDPKAFFLNHIRPVSLEQLERVLRPYGFRMQSVGINELWKEKGGRRYSLSSNVDPAKINFCTYHGYGGGRWQLDDFVPLAIDGLMLRLKRLGLIPQSAPDNVRLTEAEDPKAVFKQVVSKIRYEPGDNGRSMTIVDGRGNTIRYTTEYGPRPTIGWLMYLREEAEANGVGLRLLETAFDYARSKRELDVTISPFTRAGKWDVDIHAPDHLRNLIHRAARARVTGASGAVIYMRLEP